MKTQKLIVGTLVAGVVMLFLGYLIYGMLLMDFMSENSTDTTGRPMEEFIWWAMVAFNLVWGLLLSVILAWANAESVGEGIKIGAVVGILAAFGNDLATYAMTTRFNNFSVILVDTLALGVMYAVAGALAVWAMGKVGNRQ